MTALSPVPSMAHMSNERHPDLQVWCEGHLYRAEFYPGTHPADGYTGWIRGRWGLLVIYGLPVGTYDLEFAGQALTRRTSSGVVATLPLENLTVTIEIEELLLRRIGR